MSGAGGIETSQLQPNDPNEADDRKAQVTCAAHILETGGSADDLLELLRTLGLAHDPYARDRNPTSGTFRPGKLRGPQ